MTEKQLFFLMCKMYKYTVHISELTRWFLKLKYLTYLHLIAVEKILRTYHKLLFV